MPGVLVGDEMGLTKTFTSVVAAMICKLLTEKVVMGLSLWIMCGNTLEEWVNMAQNDYPGVIGKEQVRYPLPRPNSVPCHFGEIQTTPSQGHPVISPALEPILVVTMPGVADTIQSVIEEMIYRTDLKLVNLLNADNDILTWDDPNTSINKLETRWNIHVVSYHSLTHSGSPSRNGQLSECSRRFGIIVQSHRYMTINSVGWQIVMTATIGLKHQVTAMLGFHSHYNWCYQTMWQLSGAPVNREDMTLMENHNEKAFYFAVKSWMNVIRTEDQLSQPDATQRMSQMAMPWTITRWLE